MDMIRVQAMIDIYKQCCRRARAHRKAWLAAHSDFEGDLRYKDYLRERWYALGIIATLRALIGRYA